MDIEKGEMPKQDTTGRGIKAEKEDPEENNSGMMGVHQGSRGLLMDPAKEVSFDSDNPNPTIKQELHQQETTESSIHPTTTTMRKRRFMTFESEGFGKSLKGNKLLRLTLNIKKEINDEV